MQNRKAIGKIYGKDTKSGYEITLEFDPTFILWEISFTIPWAESTLWILEKAHNLKQHIEIGLSNGAMISGLIMEVVPNNHDRTIKVKVIGGVKYNNGEEKES